MMEIYETVVVYRARVLSENPLAMSLPQKNSDNRRSLKNLTRFRGWFVQTSLLRHSPLSLSPMSITVPLRRIADTDLIKPAVANLARCFAPHYRSLALIG